MLDRVEDYVEHEIAPPPELAKAYAALSEKRDSERKQARSSHLEKVLAAFEKRLEWWNKDFPKGSPPPPPPPKHQSPRPAAPPRSNSPSTGNATTLDTVSVVGTSVDAVDVASVESTTILSAEQIDSLPVGRDASAVALLAPGTVRPAGQDDARASDEPQISIDVQAWKSDAPYVARLRAAKTEDIYAIYLDQRPDYARSVGFFQDVAEILFERGQKRLALRVLSNLSEMDLENHRVLRILGYRLMQAGEPALAIPVFDTILRIADYEPQSYRDLGNALAAAGRGQEAIDALAEVVLRPWDNRFADIELIALTELNAIAASAKTPLDTSRVDPRLRRNLPLDLRAVLTWDADDSDMDLWVTDPNGEKCFYGHQLTYQGGRMSNDFTGGYGPEEFSLRIARKGHYKVEVNYYGDRQQSVAGPTSLQLRLTTKFGTPVAVDKLINLRLKDAKETILVGEFDVE